MTKTVAEYRLMGMDERTARYFAGGRRRIVSAVAMPQHRVKLEFENGEIRLLDLSKQFVAGSVFEKIAAEDDFARVFVDEAGNLAWDIDSGIDSSVVWNNRIDCCRDKCYLDSVPV